MTSTTQNTYTIYDVFGRGSHTSNTDVSHVICVSFSSCETDAYSSNVAVFAHENI